MAKFGFDYKADTESAENQGGGGFELLPEMFAVLEATAADIEDTKDNEGKQAKMVFDILEPEEFKGRKIWAYWTLQHPDPKKLHNKYNGKPKFDCFCMSVDVLEPEDTDDLLFKQFVAKVGVSKGGDKKDAAGKVIGKYNDKNQIDEFFFPSAPDSYPEIGVIAGGATSAPANDNVKAANTNTRTAAAATKPPAGKRPWDKSAA